MSGRDTIAKAPASLTLENICVSYGGIGALFGVSLEVPAGSVTAVLGANGAGKSSLVRAVAGAVRLTSGRVLLDDVEITNLPAHSVMRRGVVLVPEGRSIFPHLTVVENLQISFMYALAKPERAKAMELVFETFPPLAARRRIRAGLLSGGEQQMLALARVVATRPRVLLADETSLGLAPRFIDLIFEVFAQARAAGITILLVEQYVNKALDLADRVCMLQRGKVSWQGAPSEVGSDLLNRYLGEAVEQV